MQMRYTMRQNYDHPVDDSLTNITWLGKMGVNNFLPVPLERERKLTEVFFLFMGIRKIMVCDHYYCSIQIS